MVFKETQEPRLVAHVGTQVVADSGRVLADDPFAEPLVVAEVEPVLLKLPLQVPVGLGDEHGLRVPAAQVTYHGRPEFLARLAPCPAAPGPGEDVAGHQHGHVAADSVALASDARQRLGRRSAHGWRERVELHDVGPWRKIRVAAAGQHMPSDGHPAPWVRLDVVFIAVHEQLRVARHPGVVRGGVVGHAVEEQPRAAGGQGGTRRGQRPGATEGRVDHVPADAVRRPDDVPAPQARQRIPERRLQPGIRIRQGQSGRASFPYPHQPDRVDTGRGDRIPVGGRHVGQRQPPPARPGQPIQPDRGVDLVDHRLRRPPRHRVTAVRPGASPRSRMRPRPAGRGKTPPRHPRRTIAAADRDRRASPERSTGGPARTHGGFDSRRYRSIQPSRIPHTRRSHVTARVFSSTWVARWEGGE